MYCQATVAEYSVEAGCTASSLLRSIMV